ncbi:hypothetical protein DPMN_123586 [Dreissena polymorpha]|uniref:CCHC-type domain-containing protein n=1 Tax=Dreissena polymorpha TaxID=45954 RepID=A0A9D4GU10_DREPO|nr:hypothetical protein DPMN_123586 [Dreissena polymorpha]
MRSTYQPESKHPFAGYSPRLSNQRPARRFGYADRTPANHPTYSDQGQGHRDQQMKRIGNLPKTLTYDGKSNLRASYVKFSKYAEAQRWTAQDCKDNLCWCLTGKAGNFFANLVEKYDDMEYIDIIKRFEKRFGYQDFPETATIAFNTARQEREEDLDDWADRIMTLATKAFRDLPEDYIYRQAVIRFCHGCFNKEADEMTANARLSTMEAAVDKVKWAVHTHTAVHGRAKRDVRQTSVQDISQGCSVYAVKEESQSPTGQSTLTRLGGCEKRLDTIEQQISQIKTSVDNILKRLPHRQPRSASPSPNRLPSTLQCFNCKENHYFRDCPHRTNDKSKRVQFVEGKEEENEEHLISSGSDEEGEARPQC